MEILLHTCCAVCLIYPLESLRQQGFKVEGLFYNPNIHPYTEYLARRKAAEQVSASSGLRMIYPEYLPQEFFQAVNTKEGQALRCPICWELRLRQTALLAKEKGCRYFTTTLLVSPYQNQDTLKELGESVAKETGVDFFYEDFRPGFRKAHDQAKAQGIYCQKYCGCIYSETERFKKTKTGSKNEK